MTRIDRIWRLFICGCLLISAGWFLAFTAGCTRLPPGNSGHMPVTRSLWRPRPHLRPHRLAAIGPWEGVALEDLMRILREGSRIGGQRGTARDAVIWAPGYERDHLRAACGRRCPRTPRRCQIGPLQTRPKNARLRGRARRRAVPHAHGHVSRVVTRSKSDREANRSCSTTRTATLQPWSGVCVANASPKNRKILKDGPSRPVDKRLSHGPTRGSAPQRQHAGNFARELICQRRS